MMHANIPLIWSGGALSTVPLGFQDEGAGVRGSGFGLFSVAVWVGMTHWLTLDFVSLKGDFFFRVYNLYIYWLMSLKIPGWVSLASSEEYETIVGLVLTRKTRTCIKKNPEENPSTKQTGSWP